MSENTKNPAEYGYLGDEIIPVPVREYWRLKELVDEILLDETKYMYPEKYKFVDTTTGNTVAKLTDKNKATSRKIVNVEATLQGSPVVSRTPRGMKLLEIKLSLNKLHLEMIENGTAKHIPTLQAEQAQEGKDPQPVETPQENYHEDDVQPNGETTEGTEQ